MKHGIDNFKHAMRYSAAYPTGRERILEPQYDAPEKLCFEGKVAKGDGEAARKGPRAERWLKWMG